MIALQLMLQQMHLQFACGFRIHTQPGEPVLSMITQPITTKAPLVTTIEAVVAHSGISAKPQIATLTIVCFVSSMHTAGSIEPDPTFVGDLFLGRQMVQNQLLKFMHAISIACVQLIL
jgi:hypothetical protein